MASSDRCKVVQILATTSIVDVLPTVANSQSFLSQDALKMVLAVGNLDDLVGLRAEVGEGWTLLGSIELALVAHNLAGDDDAVLVVSVVVSVLQ